MLPVRKHALLMLFAFAAGCGRLDTVGKAPDFTPVEGSDEHYAMYAASLPDSTAPNRLIDEASLWTGNRQSLLGDRRAGQRGDILTVVIEIDDKAEISNSSGRSRSGSEKSGLQAFLGIPQRIDSNLPDGATTADAFASSSTSTYQGDGSVQRNEKLTLRIAATVIETLPNGILRIEGSQEVRVNFEVRELVVTGFVRPEDVSRVNEITYDKIAGARIAYGGRGQISEVQQPRYGQQIADKLLPF